jgi:hypothetical protein
LVVVVHDDELGYQADGFAVAAEDLGAERVERSSTDEARSITQKVLQPATHLLGSTVGERDGADAARADAYVTIEVGDTVGDDTGFPAARAGHDQKGAIDVFHSLALGGVESFK